jgi:hypothetical protein
LNAPGSISGTDKNSPAPVESGPATTAEGSDEKLTRAPQPHLALQSWRMTVRDWRSGELTMLLLALVLAVAALSSVGFLADRMRLGLERDGRQMIGRPGGSSGPPG